MALVRLAGQCNGMKGSRDSKKGLLACGKRSMAGKAERLRKIIFWH